MLHCDEESLSLVALGEAPTPAQDRHLRECAECREELSALRRVVDAARVPALAGDAPGTQAPPPHVWQAIAAATGVTAAPRTEPVAGTPADASPLADVVPLAARRASTEPDVGGNDRGAAPTDPVGPRRGRRFGTGTLLAVAAAALAIGAVAGGGVVSGIDSDPPLAAPAPSPTVLVQVRLDALPQPVARNASGSAEVVQVSGTRELVVDVSDLARTDGFLEVWLIDKSVKRMVPVGVIAGSQGRFTLPEGLDLGDYPIVDVSVEPLDGDPAHSGASVLRGVISS